jgi:hypothetical protein
MKHIFTTFFCLILLFSCSNEKQEDIFQSNLFFNSHQTTIDANFQTFAEKVLNQTLEELKSKNVTN